MRARIGKSKRSWAEADVVELLEPSPERIEPEAPHPGAPWQVLPYERQLEEKEAQVREALERIGGFESPPVEPIVPAVERLRYRNKLEYSFGKDEDGELVLGFHRAGRWDLIDDVEDDILASERVNEVREAVKAWCREEGLDAWDRDDQLGLLRNLVVREGRRTGQVQARVVTSPGSDFRVDELAAATPADSFLWTRAEGVAETTRGGDTKAVKGPAFLEEELAGLSFRISPDAFFQTNTEMAERLYGAATEFAGLTRPREGARPVLRHRDDLARAGARRRGGLGRRAGRGRGGRRDRERQAERRGQRALLRGRRAARDARAARAVGQPGRRGSGPAPRRPLTEGRPPDHRGGGAADRLRLLQPDDARAERAPARGRRRLRR